MLLGRYEVIDTLGEGGFSRVFRAFDTKMEREVAVKMISASKKTAVRALREAKTVALLNHPNIVTLYEFEEQENYYYLIMELVEGRSLAEILDRFERLPAEMVVAVAVGVCEALECAHTNDVIHRDIKPANLRVLNDGRVKVMDFGIARLRSAAKTSGLTVDGEIIGTFAYMSPEQSGGENIDERSDIFSMGVLLYQLTTGRLPFQSDTPAGTIYKIINETPVEPYELVAGISPALNQTIMKALEKNPDDRFASAGELRNALERCRENSGAPTDVIREGLGQLRAPRRIGSGVTVTSIRARLASWVEEYGDTLTVSALAVSCALTAAWSSAYLPIMETSLRLFAPVVVFFATLFVPPLGLAAVLGLICAGLWQISIYLGGISLLAFGVYWFTLGRGFPQFAVLPLLAPTAAWLGVPFLFPLAVGVAFGPVLAGFLAGFGALTLAAAELIGRLDYGWAMTTDPALVSTVRFGNEVADLPALATYFTAQPWLAAQIAIWTVTAVMMGSIKNVKSRWAPWAAAGVGAAVVWLGYRFAAQTLEAKIDLTSLVVRPLGLSAAILIGLMFVFIHPRRRPR